MIDTKELRRLAQEVSEWSCCNQAWLDQSEDVPAATVGHIDEDGNTYPIATIDCDQYYAAHQSLPLAKFYAAANPAAISELLDRLEAAEAECLEQARLNGMGSEREAALMAKLEAAEKERDFAKTEIARLHDDIRELTDVRVLDEEDRDLIVAWRQGTATKPAPSVPDGWLRAIDEALVTAHIGVANAEDTYEQAKVKLDSLIGFHVDVATDPAVNGGWKLVPVAPTFEMLVAGEDMLVPTYTDTPVSVPFDVYRAMLAAAPEARP